MKKKTSSPYRSFELKKVEAPNRLSKDEPKVKAIKGSCDYRFGGNK